jgi:hypothetical protein
MFRRCGVETNELSATSLMSNILFRFLNNKTSNSEYQKIAGLYAHFQTCIYSNLLRSSLYRLKNFNEVSYCR